MSEYLEKCPYYTVEKGDGDDLRVVVANLTEPMSALRTGTKCFICQNTGMFERCYIRAKSRGGRWIEMWVPLKRLTNFRWSTVPKEHPARRGLSWLRQA